MKKFKLYVLAFLVAAVCSKSAFALNCVNTAYGSLCSSAPADFELRKTVSKLNSSETKDRLLGVKKGDTFVFYFKVTNNTLNDITLKLKDDLPFEYERVSGSTFTETVNLFPKSSKTVEMVVKVKDSEFDGKSLFVKCVVNKAYLYKGSDLKDTSTATVCYGDGFGSKLADGSGVLGDFTPSVVKPTADTDITVNNFQPFLMNIQNFCNFGFFNWDSFNEYVHSFDGGGIANFLLKQWLFFTFWIFRQY